jgi:hypothetical protein
MSFFGLLGPELQAKWADLCEVQATGIGVSGSSRVLVLHFFGERAMMSVKQLRMKYGSDCSFR